MKVCTKICIWLGGLLLAAGVILFVCAMTEKGWDFGTLNTLAYEQKEFTAQEEITDIRIDFKVSKIEIVQDKDAQKLTCSYPVAKDLAADKRAEVTISEENGVLHIAEKALPFSPFRWNAHTPALTLSLPESLNTLTVSTDVGDIDLQGLTDGKIQVKTESGNIVCRNVQAKEISLSAEFGNVAAENCTTEGAFVLLTDAGNIHMKDLKAEKVSASTSLGDITLQGTFAAKEAAFSADTGDIDLSEGTADAEKLSFFSSLGDIRAILAGAREEYAADVQWDLGDTNLYPSTGGERTLTVRCDCGDIDIRFTE